MREYFKGREQTAARAISACVKQMMLCNKVCLMSSSMQSMQTMIGVQYHWGALPHPRAWERAGGVQATFGKAYEVQDGGWEGLGANGLNQAIA